MVNCIGRLGGLTCGLLFSLSPIAMEDEWSFDELSTVVSASRINQTVLSAPNAVTIIDSAMIETSGFTKIADIFRLVPGMNVAHVNGRRYAVSYHGGNWDDTNWLQVLVNGRSAFMSNLSVIDWDVLGVELEDIEKVEIIRGPSASAYGSNSFAAAINIITKPIALQNDWTASTRFGIDHDQRNFARFTTSIDDANLRLTLNTVRYRGFSEMDDSKELYSAQFGYEQPFGKNDQINAYGHYSFGETGYQPPVEEANNDPRPRTLDSYAGQITWERSLDNQNSLETQIHHTVRNEDNFKLSPTIQELLPDDLTGTPFEDNADERFPTGRETFFTTKTQIETQYSWLNQQGFRAVGLLGIKRDTFESLPLTSGNNTFEQYTAFAGINTEIQLGDKIDINLGLLAEKQNDDQVYFSPRLSLNLFISPLQSIRLTHSVARRLPTLLEKHLDIALYTSDGDLFNRVSVPDDHLTPVILSNYEVGYTGRSRQKAIDWNFSLYHMEVDNIVWINYIPDPTDPVDGYYLSLQNGGFYSTSGVEGEITYRPSQYNMY
ncbi:MAG: TonB-dependent receptor plug domain-containing protein, partial [Pseudomonadota bacterium]|nr:TonB-dependent receptor plug domain-containing protein [Pseudomonadota bacterium]